MAQCKRAAKLFGELSNDKLCGVRTRRPTHPGHFLKEEILKPQDITNTEASKLLGISRNTISRFVNEKTRCSPAMAKRLSVATGTSVSFWLRMQLSLDTWMAESLELSTEVTVKSMCTINEHGV